MCVEYMENGEAFSENEKREIIWENEQMNELPLCMGIKLERGNI